MVDLCKRPGAFSLEEIDEILEAEKMLGQYDFDMEILLRGKVNPKVQKMVNQIHQNIGEFSARLILTIKAMRNGEFEGDYRNNIFEPKVYVCGCDFGVRVNAREDHMSPKGNQKRLEGHVGDCSIFSSLINENPNDGICNCGYGLQRCREDNYSEMYSEELLERLNVVGAGLPWGI